MLMTEKKKPAAKKAPAKKPAKKAPAKKRAVKPKVTPAKSKVKAKIAKKAEKPLPAYMTDKISLKHYRFALKYVELDMNGTQAYLAVYGEDYKAEKGKEMTDAVASAASSRLLCNVKVQAHVKELIEELILEDKTHAKRILARYNRWADSDISDYVEIKEQEVELAKGVKVSVRTPKLIPFDQLTPDQRKNIKSISVTKDGFKLELVDKKGSNDQLAKLSGLDKREEAGREIHIHFDKLDEQL